jgi:hypothetical protein
MVLGKGAIKLPLELVPVLYEGEFNAELIKTLVDGRSQVPGATNIREGVVILSLEPRHVHGLGRAQLKLVSNQFLEKDAARYEE